MTSTTPQAGRIPGLDGWRAVAIGLVLISHGTFNASIAPQFCVDFFNSLPRGVEGVRIFFCLSGFLITHLLLREEAKFGRISLKSFYARRALRILPVYFAYVGTIALLNAGLHWGLVWNNFIPPVTFTTGLWLRRYDTWVFMHFWSLSVEEIFYLLWPLFFVAAPKRYRIATVVTFLVLLPVARMAGDGTTLEFCLTGMDLVTNVDYLLMGCLFALLYGPLVRRSAALPSWGLTVVKCGGLFFLLLSWYTMNHGSNLGLTRQLIRTASLGPGTTLMAFAITVLIVATALSPTSWLTRLLEARPAAALGVISYSVYIWQQLILNPFVAEPAVWQRFPANIMVAIAAGWISYNCYEKWFLHWKQRFARGV